MTIVDEFRQDEQRVLDRLIDGELGVHERSQLLAALDDEPDAWRRCSLAFLESQSWRWQMSRIASEPILAQIAGARSGSRPSGRVFWGGFLAIAASLVVAFGLGTRFPTLSAIADTPLPDAPAANDQAPTGVPRLPISPANQLAESTTAAPLPWQTMLLTPVGAGESVEPIAVRVAADSAEQPIAERAALSSRLTSHLEQEGWQVRRRRQLVPVELEDGRQLVFPIEEIDLHGPEVIHF